MATLTSAQHVFMFLWIIGSVAAGALEVKAEPGGDVTLQCNSSAAVQKLVWSRPGLGDKYVFYFSDNRFNKDIQHAHYHGRVERKDSAVENGGASVLLKNVDIDDSGMYKCKVTPSSEEQFINLTVSKDPGEVKAKPGEDVTLQCNGPTDANITKIKWDRPGMKGLSVFFVRENRPYEKYQDPRYHGRVELKDTEVKNRDASVLLKNIDIDDSGTYQCEVTTSNMPGETDLLRSVLLIVSEGPEKEIKNEQPEPSSCIVGWLVSLLLVCPLVGGACFALGRFVFPKPKSGPL